jgi:hypothetical protein
MRRALNEIEYLNWCIGQPYNMVVVVRLRGELWPDQLREALDKAQQRHPLLGVNTELDAAGMPWFSSEGVGEIPLAVLDQAEPEDARALADRELVARFDMDVPGASRLPLMRASMLRLRASAQLVDVVFTVQHVIGDGLSMVFLVRDLLRFIAAPGTPVAVLDAPASLEDLLPAKVRRRIPSSPLRFDVALWLAKRYVRLRFGRRAVAPSRQPTQRHCAWELTPEQTSRLRARCRREGVSVQSAICTAFLSGFPAVHTPVSLRSRLARPVGESFGLFVGAAEVRMRYRATLGLWANARRFHRRLQRALREPFRIFTLISKAVPAARVRELGPLLVRIASDERPFAVTNLGQLDGNELPLRGETLRIESFFGAVTGIVDSSVLTVYTLDGRMRLHMLANEPGPSDTTIRDEAERGVTRLLAAIDG